MSNNSKIFDIKELVSHVKFLKKKNLIIGFTNGCFDLLHMGHLTLLLQAKKKCDYLIIGLNSDLSVKNIKGENRPVDNEEDRIQNLSIRDEVDAIILFSEETPLKIIKEIIPNKLFKGSDYKKEIVVGAEFVIKNGGNVEFIDILEGYSTTNIINKTSI
ncbi:adenylyltransferase/cytidyltransferase family protein [Pelagibacteraceae bacterium]|nr:adenylyltransferase/cytidyltransferase family protein [Pelagibacteraceae bacterium]